ncbi:hypothetical protein KPH14_001090 [Odynerus spinipes]|uniref:THD domain-containing protein n=1 Tax=Odynerus spinipes TaxID=1348599 RepID=A0AAD9VVM1_9HYME|nr:hypothetical protein KPH14_001090 [Odynerus spinipes]
MTTVLSDEDGNAMKLKRKFLNGSNVKEESRSFLNFSRENLDISHTDLEEGFNKQRFKPNRYMILSTSALLIALLCFGLETWKLRCSLANAREIEELKRDVKSLKHRFIQQDLLDELKAFEEQLYAGESTDEEDPGEVDIENAEYDSNYDDEDSSVSHDYSADSETTSTPDPVSDKTLVEILAALRKVEAKRGEEFEKNVRDNHRNIERERLEGRIEDIDVRGNEDKFKEQHGETRQQNEEAADMIDPIKRKRSIREENESLGAAITSRAPRQRNHTRKVTGSRHRLHTNEDSGRIATNNDRVLSGPISGLFPERHPPKKFYSHTHSETSRAFSSSRYDDGNLSVEMARSTLQTREEKDHAVGRSNMEIAGVSRELRRSVTRRHLRVPRQVYAVHYGADSILFSNEDEHTGNGRARHGNGIFKAWRPSDWVTDLNMDRHFALASDGRLTVNEAGLYLVYAQIHYLDEHDENGFHLLVNGRPVLQCTIFSPGVGHKSRSCFSAQVTILHAGDILVLKDIGINRYTLFQHDKSFFGLAKLGESRQQRYPSTPPPL